MSQPPYSLRPEPSEAKAPPYPLIPEPRHQSWLERNAHWKILFGCLLLVLLIACFCVVLFSTIESSLRNSEPYKEAISLAQASPEVRHAIGIPFQVARFTTGQISVHGVNGEANFVIPIVGPAGKGAIEAHAYKASGVWRFKALLLRVEGQDDALDLLSSQPPPQREF